MLKAFIIKRIMDCMTFDYALSIVKNMQVSFKPLNELEQAAINIVKKNKNLEV